MSLEAESSEKAGGPDQLRELAQDEVALDSANAGQPAAAAARQADSLLDPLTSRLSTTSLENGSAAMSEDDAADAAAAATATAPPVAVVGKPEVSDGSASVLNLPGAQEPPSQPIDTKSAAHAVAAIKCRDFAASPPPSRPTPTTAGYSLSTSVHPDGERGMASAPAVPTLSSISSNGQTDPRLSSSTSSPKPSAGATTPGVANTLRRTGTGSGTATPSGGLASRIPPSLQAKMAAMANRSNNPTSLGAAPSSRIGGLGATPSSSGHPMMPSLASRPSAPAGAPGRVGAMGPVAGRGPTPGMAMGGLGKRRGPGAGLNLAQMGGGDASSSTAGPSTSGANGAAGPAGRPSMKLPPGSTGGAGTPPQGHSGSPFSNFSKIVDPSGSLNFQNKAVLHAKGVDFSNGSSFAINMDDLELREELGSGNYGTVQKVYHKVTKVTMAMKEIRLELDDSKLKGIITELDILHRAVAPEIVEFYGAFFIESCVYYCMEFMDASLDKLAGTDVPEPVLKRVTASIVRGLKFLKDELQIMHRDVKPTNVLVNAAGSIKLCDFGVSGQLERSLAKTNIGCQSYMAPERIKGESQNFLGSYTVSSDVWSLGLTIIEFAVGHYPYPPETYSNVFAQLQAIVHGDPPGLPDGYSKDADNFVALCLQKDANKRPSYAQLLRTPFLRDDTEVEVDMATWVRSALDNRKMSRTASSASSASGTSV